MNPSTLCTIGLVLALVLGILCPWAACCQSLIRYGIFFMLWMAFLDVQLSGFRREHAAILAANWGIGLAAWALLLPFNHDLAMAALLIGLTPSATSSPVVTGILGGKVEFVTASVLLTNVTAGFLLPLALPVLLRKQIAIPLGQIVTNTLLTVLLPLIVAQLCRVFLPRLTRAARAWSGITFYIWLGVLFLVTANASHFLLTHASALRIGAAIALIAASLCAVNFWIGWKIGGKNLAQESSQSLGQKNTLLTIWIALTFINPLVALGPTFYVICHNTYNAWQIAHRGKKS